MIRHLLANLLSRVVILSVFSVCAVSDSFSQCSPNTATTISVDLSSAQDTTFSTQSNRNGNACTGTNCIVFNITLNPGSNFLNFSVVNPAPSGSAYYQINCGPQTSIGVPVCISGMGTVCISYCKPGNDNPTYKITASSGIAGPPNITVRQGCSAGMTITGLQLASINWTSIYPGAAGAYNSYLSCTSGCSSTTYTPQAGAPPYIDYKVSGTKICGGILTDTVRVYTVSPLSVAITPANPTICGSNSVVLTATPTGGGAPYSYLWSNGQTTQSITVNTIGTYTVTVTDTTNCPPVSSSVNVTAGALPPTPVAGNNGALCVGSTLNLTATTVAGATYSWTGPNGFTSGLQNPSVSNVSLTNAGTYSVTATVSGCTSTAATTTVVVNSIPTAPIAANNGPLCVGSTLNLTATTVAGATYSWTGPNGFTSSLQNPSVANVIIANAGTYSVTATVNGCTSPAATTTVIINPIPVTPTAGNSGPLCVGSILNLTATTITGATYSWTGPNGFIGSLQNPSIANVILANAGTYSVTATLNSCTSPAGTTTVVVNPIPSSPTLGNNGPLCVGATLNLTATTVAGATYSWTGPNSFTSTVQNPSIANISLTTGGTYSVTVTVNGCTSAAGTITVIVNAIPSSPTASNNGPLCVGSTLNLTATTIAGATYSWTGPNGFTTNVQSPSIANVSLSNAGMYSVAATVNGCTSPAATTTVVINPIPTAPTAGNNGPLCVGSTLNLTSTTVAGATYSWAGPNSFTSSLQNPLISNITLGNAGTYNVTATINGCTSPASTTTVVVNSIPSSPTAGNNGALCVGSTLNLTATTVAGATYSWTGPNSFTSSVQNPSINNIALANAGMYSVTATVNGCTSPAATTTVVINSIPAAPSAGNNGPLCVGSALNLTATTVTGASYSWIGPNGFSSSLQNPTVNNSSLVDAGTYSVTATVNGCTSPAATSTVVINPIPSAPTTGNNSPLCVGSTLNLTATTVAGATYNWTGPNSFTSSLQNPSVNNVSLTNAGMYSVTATVNGCTSPAGTTTVVINPIPPSPIAGNNGSLCVGSTLNLTATPVAGATYNWTGPNSFTSNIQNPFINNVDLINGGTYSVTATVNGCTSAAATTTVVVNPIPSTPTAGNNGPLCDGSTLNLTSTTVAGVTYTWTGPNSFTANIQNPSINNIGLIDAGTYNVTATMNGCTSSATTTVVVNAIPASPTASNSGPLCVGSTLNLTATTVAAATYNWTGPNSYTSTVQNPSITNLSLSTAGTYSVTVTVNGCTSPAATTAVVVNAIPAAPTAGNNGPLCVGSALNLTATTVAGASYSWSGPNGFSSTVQSPSISNVTLADAGAYSVTATVNSCTSLAATTTAVVNAIPTTPTAGNNGALCVGSIVNLTAATVTGATYNWTGPNGFTSSAQNPSVNNISLANAGTYSVTATVNGCTSPAATTTVLVNPIPPAPTAGNNGPLCAGSVLNLTATTVTGATYSWTGPNGFTSSLQNPTINNSLLADAGIYNVTATVNGCTSVAGSTTVLINPTPLSPTAGNNGALCVGSILNLTATTVTGASYSWTGPNGFTSSLQNPTINNSSLADAGIYNVTATVNGCSSLVGTTTVVINAIPAAPTVSNNGALCVGLTLNLTASSITGATYNWNGPNTYTSSIQNPSINNISLTNAGTYNVTATINGCTSPAAATTVVINPIPTAPTASNNGALCVGTALNLTATTVTGASYSWTGPNGFSSTAQNPSINNVSIADAGTYSVTATINGCTSPAATITVVVNSIPAAPTAGSNGPLCIGSTLNLNATTVTGAIYNWTGPNGFASSVQNPTINNSSLADAGIYSVTATVNGCTSIAGTTTVVVNSIPATPTAGNNGSLCVGSTLNLTATTVAGATYNWIGPNSFTSSVQNPSITNVILANAGTYSVTATINGCISPVSTTSVIVNPIPGAPTAGNNGPLCTGSTLNLSATTVAGANYSWTGPNGFTSSLQNPTINNSSLADAGIYSATVTVNGCTSAAGTTTVVVNPIPSSPTLGNNGPLCVGSTLNLNATTVAGATYSWTGPNSFISIIQNPSIANISLTTAGTYSVTVTVNGCTSPVGTTTVVVNPIPSSPTAGNNGPLCVGSILNLMATTVTGAAYSWTGPDGYTSSQQNPTITNSTLADTGSYSVTATVNGCTSLSSSTTVVIHPIPAAPTAGNNGPLCVGSTLNLTASSVIGGRTTSVTTYSWTGPNGFTSSQQNPMINATMLANAGVYTVTATVNGCTSLPSTTTVIINPIPAVPTAGNNGPLCVGSIFNLSAVTVPGATYDWTGPNGFTSTIQNPILNNVTIADAGTYNVTATVNGCTSPASTTTVIVNPIPPIPTAGNNGPLCVGSTLNLTATTVTGATYTWTATNAFSSTQQNPTINATSLADAGAYSVTATANGCTSAASTTTVIVNAIPAAPTAGNNGALCVGSTLNLTATTVTGAIYNWTGANGFTSTQQNPSINNTGLNNAGMYNVTATMNGCTSPTTTTTVVINPIPPAPTAGNNGPLCAGSPLNLISSSLTGATYSWTGPNTFTSAIQNPSINNVSLVNAGAYRVTATVNGCTSPADSTTVTIHLSPVSNAGNNQTICNQNSNVILSGSVTGGSTTGTWSTSGTGTFTSINSLATNYNLSNSDKSSGNIILTLTSTNNGACPASVSSLTIAVTPTIIVDAGIDKQICINENTISLNGNITSGFGGIWTSNGSGNFSPSNTALNANYTVSNKDKANGSIKLTLTSIGNGSCVPITDELTVKINSLPLVNAGPDQTIFEGQTITLRPIVSNGIIKYLWTPNLYLDNNSLKNVSVTGKNDQMYTLTVTDASGCTNEDDVLIKVLKPFIIPNTFTPNNDGINDTWIIKELEKYTEARVQVFNRYGQLVFESRGYTKPWDGTYNGKSLPFGTYYYVIEAGNGVKPYTGYVTIIK